MNSALNPRTGASGGQRAELRSLQACSAQRPLACRKGACPPARPVLAAAVCFLNVCAVVAWCESVSATLRSQLDARKQACLTLVADCQFAKIHGQNASSTFPDG